MTKSTNKKSSTKPPKSSGGLGGSDYKDQESAARALHRVIQNLDATVGSLARNFQSIGAGNKDIAKQIASTVMDARSLNNTYDYTVTVTSKVNALQQVSNKWYSDRFNIATDLLGLSDAEALNLDIALSKGKDRNDESLRGLDIQKRLSKLSDEDRKRAESYLDLRKKYFAQEKNQTAALTVLTNSQIQRVQTAQIKADLAQQAAKADFVSRIKDEIKSNELSNEAIELRFKQSQIEQLISELQKDGTEAGKAALKALQDERKELADAYETRLEIDELLRKQTKELEKQKVLHHSIDDLIEKSKGLLGDEGEEVLEIGKAIKESLVSPMALVGALIGSAVQEFGKIGRLGRELLTTTGLTVDQTEHLRHYAHDLSLEFRAQGVQLKDVLDAQAALVDQYGTVNRVTDEATEKVTLLGKAFGIPAQASAGVLYQLQKSTGASAKVAGNVAALGANFAKAAGVAPTAVFQDISQSSEQIAQYFKGTPADLMRTAVEARRLGLTLGKVADISKALLNFESSIEDQMTASVLLGREINLDKARQLAMEGKIEEAAKETLSQIGSLADFNKMNAVQKEAIAKAAGMTVGDLQQSLEKQEALKNMTAEQRAEYQKGLAALKSQNMTTAEKMLMDQRNQLTQEKIADAVAKISDIFANVILPVLEPIFDLISGIFNFIEPILPLLKTALQLFIGWKVTLMAIRGISKSIDFFKGLNKDSVGKGLGAAKNGIKGLGSSMKDQLKDAWSGSEKESTGVFSKIKDKFKSIFSKKDVAGTMTEKTKEMASKVAEMKKASPGMTSKEALDKIRSESKTTSAVKPAMPKVETKDATGAVDKTASIAEKGAKSDAAVKGPKAGEGIKNFLQNLAKGLKAMADGKVVAGAGATVLAAPALLIMSPVALIAKLIEKVDGPKFKESMVGIAKGIAAFGDGKVVGGAGAIVLATPGLLLMSPVALIAKLIEKIDGPKFKESMTGIAKGVAAFGDGKVVAGSLAIILTVPGLLLMSPISVIAKLIERIDGPKFKESMVGISKGVASFGDGKVIAGAMAMILAAPALLLMGPVSGITKLIERVDGPKFKESMTGISKGIATFADSKIFSGAVAMILAAPALLLMGPVSIIAKLIERVDGKKLKEALNGIANGISTFSDSKIISGSLGITTSAFGLLSMGPASKAAKLIEGIDGEKISEVLSGLADSIKEFSDGKIILGAGAMLLASPGLLAIGVASIPLAILGGTGKLIEKGLQAISKGIGYMGSSAVLKGALGIAVLGASIIPAIMAFKMIEGLDSESIITFSLALGGLGAAAAILGNFAGQLIMGSVGLAVLGAALIPAAYAFKMIEGLDTDSIVTFSLAISGLAAVATLLGNMAPQLLLGSIGIGVLGAALIPAAYAFKMIEGLDTNSIITFGLAIAGLAGVATLLGSVAPLMIMGAGGIAILGAALIPAALAFKMIENINADSVKTFGLAVTGLSLAAAGIGLVSPLVIAGATAIGILGIALIPFAGALNLAAPAIDSVGTSLDNLIKNVTPDALAGMAEGLLSVAKGLGAISLAGIGAIPVLGAMALAGPAISAVGSIFGEDKEPPKEAAKPGTTTTETTTQTVDNSGMNEAILAKLDQLINVISNAKGELKINNTVMGEWIGLSTARNYKAVK